MLKSLIFFTASFIVFSVHAQIGLDNDPAVSAFYAQKITDVQLEEFVYQLASEEFQGRETGTRGQN